MVNTLDLGLTFKNFRTFLSKTALYRSSPPSIAITHPTSTSVSPTIKSFLPLEQNQKHLEFKQSIPTLSPSVSLEHSESSLVFLLHCRSLPHAKPRLQGLLPNLPRNDIPRGQISIRLPVRRQTPRLPELWRDHSRTGRVRDSVPRLLTSLQAMWLLDLREHTNETRRKRKRDGRKPSTHHKGLSRHAR